MDVFLICMGLFVLLLGVSGMIWPRHVAEREEARYRELDDGAFEAYFEEKRSLEAYGHWSSSPGKVRFSAGVQIVSGFVLILLGIFQ